MRMWASGPLGLIRRPGLAQPLADALEPRYGLSMRIPDLPILGSDWTWGRARGKPAEGCIHMWTPVRRFDADLVETGTPATGDLVYVPVEHPALVSGRTGLYELGYPLEDVQDDDEAEHAAEVEHRTNWVLKRLR